MGTFTLLAASTSWNGRRPRGMRVDLLEELFVFARWLLVERNDPEWVTREVSDSWIECATNERKERNIMSVLCMTFFSFFGFARAFLLSCKLYSSCLDRGTPQGTTRHPTANVAVEGDKFTSCSLLRYADANPWYGSLREYMCEGNQSNAFRRDGI